MGLRIQNNIAAMNAHRNLGISDRGLSKSLQRLSSGYRINSAADDAAGLAVASGMRADIASYKVASRNTSEAIALLQVAEGAYDQIGNILNRIKELTTQGTSANGAQNTTDITNEVTALRNEIDRIAGSTEYNGETVLRGYGTAIDFSATGADTTGYSTGLDTAAERAAAGLTSVTGSGVTDNVVYSLAHASSGILTIHNDNTSESQAITASEGAQTLNFDAIGITLELGPNFVAATTIGEFCTETLQFTVTGGKFITGTKNDSNHYIDVTIDSVNQTDLSIDGVTGIVIGNLDTVNTAISTLATNRGKIGAFLNRLGYASANISTTIENMQAAESVIRDVDMAQEMTTFTKNQILLQAGTAMLAQANMAPQQVLALFG